MTSNLGQREGLLHCLGVGRLEPNERGSNLKPTCRLVSSGLGHRSKPRSAGGKSEGRSRLVFEGQRGRAVAGGSMDWTSDRVRGKA
jgi:hypothetical protein